MSRRLLLPAAVGHRRAASWYETAFRGKKVLLCDPHPAGYRSRTVSPGFQTEGTGPFPGGFREEFQGDGIIVPHRDIVPIIADIVMINE
jgi:hypothetical protein